MKSLYINGKKFYSYYRPKPNFNSRFTNFYAVDEVAYRKKKLDSLTAFLQDNDTEEVGARKALMYRSIKMVKEELKWPAKKVAERIKCGLKTVYRALEWQDKGA